MFLIGWILDFLDTAITAFQWNNNFCNRKASASVGLQKVTNRTNVVLERQLCFNYQHFLVFQRKFYAENTHGAVREWIPQIVHVISREFQPVDFFLRQEFDWNSLRNEQKNGLLVHPVADCAVPTRRRSRAIDPS